MNETQNKNGGVKHIKTLLKFKRNGGGHLQGFVSKKQPSGSWYGCNEGASVKKKIVLVDSTIEDTMTDGVLYKTNLVPMKNDNGFVAISASEVKFDATVKMLDKSHGYRVLVSFGNKVFRYEPLSNLKRYNNIQQIASFIRANRNLNDSNRVASEFIDCACLAKSMCSRKD